MSDEVRVTPELLAKVEAFAAAAVSGPWKQSAVDCVAGGKPSHLIARCDSGYEDRSTERSTAAYIALCDPPTVLALVKRIRELESKVGRHGTQVPELREPTFRT